MIWETTSQPNIIILLQSKYLFLYLKYSLFLCGYLTQ